MPLNPVADNIERPLPISSHDIPVLRIEPIYRQDPGSLIVSGNVSLGKGKRKPQDIAKLVVRLTPNARLTAADRRYSRLSQMRMPRLSARSPR